MSGSRYLTAREAAGELGVSLKTLYAYVSRGLIRSEAVGGKRRNRRYRAEDVRKLKERKEQRRDPAQATESALDWGTPVMESAITLITEGRMYYRGRDAVALSEDHSLEQVAELIWTGNMTEGGHGRLPELFRASAGGVSERLRLEGRGASSGSPMETFGVALQAVGDPAAYDLRSAAVARTGARILRLLVAAATGGGQSAEDTVARALQRRWVPGESGAATLLDRALVLCADHELNVSSFTARCVASAGATPYAVVVAGLAALGGVKHGGNTERVEAFLAEADVAGDARRVITSRLRRGEVVPGFGHQLYPDGDPRGKALLVAVAAAYPDSAASKLAGETAEAAGDLMDERPNVDFALAVLARVLGLPPGGALALFALGRTVGWVGHAIEQYETGKIIRPRARYVGEQPSDA
ncbi:citrate synthase family protein [soil metagenome]